MSGVEMALEWQGGGEITARRSDTRRMRGIFSLRGHAHPSFYAAFLRPFDFSTLRGTTVPFLRFPQRGPTKARKFLLIPKLPVLFHVKENFDREEERLFRKSLENNRLTRIRIDSFAKREKLYARSSINE